MEGVIRQSSFDFPRMRAMREPKGASGRKVCASNSHPIYGSAGFAMSGLRPNKHAPRYQSNSAAARSQSPIANRTERQVAPTRSARTKNGESQITRMFGERGASGLSDGTGSRPFFENSSG